MHEEKSTMKYVEVLGTDALAKDEWRGYNKKYRGGVLLDGKNTFISIDRWNTRYALVRKQVPKYVIHIITNCVSNHT